MDNQTKRLYLFLIGCIGVRVILAYLAKIAPLSYLKIMGFIAILPALGFMYFFISGTRKTGPEVFGDKIWWNHLRPIHALLYILFSYNAIMGYRIAWKYLAFDVLLGFNAFILHRLNIL